jgi:hypothetical protein
MELRDLHRDAGVSKEAMSGCVKLLEDLEYIDIDITGKTKIVILTDTGSRAQAKYRRVLRETELHWRAQYGENVIDDLRAGLEDLFLVDDNDEFLMAEGLRVHEEDWRAHPPYVAQTELILEDPETYLPHYPMISHRGGFPDGS